MNNTHALAEFLAGLRYEDLPASVVEYTEELFLDWLGSALASQNRHPIPLFQRYAQRMGPANGKSRVLVDEIGRAHV